MEIGHQLNKKNILIVVVIIICGLATNYLIGPHYPTDGDTHHYLKLIQGEPYFAPFAYRLLVPKIISLLPFEPLFAFYVVNYISSFCILLIMFLIFRHLNLTFYASTITMVLLNFSYPIAYYLGYGGRIDPTCNLLFSLALLFIIRKNFLFASLTMTIGVVAKETILILLPLLFMRGLLNADNSYKFIAYVLILCVLPCASIFLLRTFVPVINGPLDINSLTDLYALWDKILAYNIKYYPLYVKIGRVFLKSVGFYWAMAACGLLFINKELRYYCVYIVLCGFALCFVAADWDRMLGSAFPGLFIPVAYFVNAIEKSKGSKYIFSSLIILSVFQSNLNLLKMEELNYSSKIAAAMGIVLIFLIGTGITFWVFYNYYSTFGVKPQRSSRCSLASRHIAARFQ